MPDALLELWMAATHQSGLSVGTIKANEGAEMVFAEFSELVAMLALKCVGEGSPQRRPVGDIIQRFLTREFFDLAAETLLDESLTLAKRLARGPVNALARIRQLHDSAATLDFESQLREEDRLQSACSAGPEAQEGRAAFRDKRAPDFSAIPLATQTP